MSNSSPLNVSQTDTQRVFVGLGWDPNASPTLKDKIGSLLGSREEHHDLDLSCYYFNQDGACLGFVGADPEHNSNPSHSIYHSGDSVEGIGDGDDEQISVELAKLPPNISQLIFKANIKSGHSFQDVAEPEIRFCDGYTELSFLETNLDHGDSTKDVYLFVRITRKGDGWTFEKIDTFLQSDSVENWEDELLALTNP